MLAHPAGGAKGLPPGARLVPFVNKVESEETLDAARTLARLLLAHETVDSVIIGAAEAAEPVREVWSRVGAVVLAAGGASRYGELKQLLPWGDAPLVAHVARQALACPDVTRVAVTLGAGADRVRSALSERRSPGRPACSRRRSRIGKPARAISVRAGLEAVEQGGAPLGSVLFLLADQPGVSPDCCRP